MGPVHVVDMSYQLEQHRWCAPQVHAIITCFHVRLLVLPKPGYCDTANVLVGQAQILD